ncbi:MAG: mechanosensitive ion channel [Spirochaetales bacterium]|nr:mechanosensitive ion channel [Spirochaetales bacterium]
MVESIIDFFISPIRINNTSLFFSPLDIILKLILPVFGIYILYKLLFFLVKDLILKPLKITIDTKNKIRIIIKRILRIILFFGFLLIIINFLGKEILKYITSIWEVLSTPFFTSGSTRISIVTLIFTIPVFFIASLISKKTKKIIDASLLKQFILDPSTKFSISNLIRYGLFTLCILLGLTIIGIDLSSIAVLFGVLGIGVGFGLQGVVANFFSGLVIFFERPIKEGDRIIISGIEGTVSRIRILSTVVDTLTNETIFIPNEKLIGNSIHNNSYKNPNIIVVNSVQVSYSSDLEQVQEILLSIARDNPYAIPRPVPEFRLIAFQDHGIEVEIRTWIRLAENKQVSLAWTNMQIWKKFKEYHIEIPFHQLDLHIKTKNQSINPDEFSDGKSNMALD